VAASRSRQGSPLSVMASSYDVLAAIDVLPNRGVLLGSRGPETREGIGSVSAPVNRQAAG